jgi:hypothetical protein
MSETKGKYELVTIGSHTDAFPCQEPEPMQYRGSDITPEIKAVYNEFCSDVYELAAEVVRLRRENKKLSEELNRC